MNPNPTPSPDIHKITEHLSQLSEDGIDLDDQVNKQKLQKLQNQLSIEKSEMQSAIQQSTQEQLKKLQEALEHAEGNLALKNALNGNDFDSLKNLVSQAVQQATQVVRTNLNSVLQFSLEEDALPVVSDALVEDNNPLLQVTSLIRRAMLEFNKLKAMVTFDAQTKRQMDKANKVEEIELYQARGLRKIFKVVGEQMGVEVMNGKKDQQAFEKLVLEYQEYTGGSLEQFVRQKIQSIRVSYDGDSAPLETTMYGIVANEVRERDVDRYSVLNSIGNVKIDNVGYLIQCHGNTLSVNGKKYVFSAHIVKKDGTRGSKLPLQFREAEVINKDTNSLFGFSYSVDALGSLVHLHKESEVIQGDNLQQLLYDLADGQADKLSTITEKIISMGSMVRYLYPSIAISIEHQSS